MNIKQVGIAALLLMLYPTGAFGQGIVTGTDASNNNVRPPLNITRPAAELSQWLGTTGSPVEDTRMMEAGVTNTPGYGTRMMGTTNTSGYGAGLELRDGMDLYGVTGGRWGATGHEVTSYGVDTDGGSHWIGLLGAIGLIGLAGLNRNKSHPTKR